MDLHLRPIRKARHLRLCDVAPAIDRSISMLSLLERGEADVSLGTLALLAQLYRVHPSELVSFPEFPLPPCGCKHPEEDFFL